MRRVPWIIACLFFLACAAAPKSAVSTVPGPGASKDNPIPIGNQVEAAKDWRVGVVRADLDADAKLIGEDQFNAPDPGRRLIVVTLAVENHDDLPGSYLGNVKTSVLLSTGEALTNKYATHAGSFEASTQLQPGGRQTGDLVFEIPVGEVDAAMLLVEPQFTLDRNVDQRYFALR